MIARTTMSDRKIQLVWHKALEPDELPEGRVKAVACGLATVCMTRYRGHYAALDNRCPHQGGPLGEGSIENGLLRCPWHGWAYAEICGALGVRVERAEDLDDALVAALAHPGAALVEVVADVQLI